MAQLRCKEVSSEIAKKNIEVWKEVVREGNLFYVGLTTPNIVLI